MGSLQPTLNYSPKPPQNFVFLNFSLFKSPSITNLKKRLVLSPPTYVLKTLLLEVAQVCMIG
jgi:hypothetical protein